jgi:hypothetical protein
MKKKLILLILLLALLVPSMSAMASEAPVVYKSTITVTADGGRYQVGFASIEFKKEFLDQSMLPATFDVQIYAEDGKAYIEFSPDTPKFFKKVHIRAGAYEGLLYDRAKGENIPIDVKKQQLIVSHFSRYLFNR